MALIQDFDGPIPGENYTSDTKNYPWHRPPEHTDLDDAIDYTIKKFGKKENAYGLITMLEMGMSVSVITRTYVISGIGQGRWTPDFAILLAGPVARIIQLMAKSYGVKADLGIDDSLPPTKVFLEGMASDVSTAKAVQAANSINPEDIKQEAADQPQPEALTTSVRSTEGASPSTGRGFMSKPTPVSSGEM